MKISNLTISDVVPFTFILQRYVILRSYRFFKSKITKIVNWNSKKKIRLPSFVLWTLQFYCYSWKEGRASFQHFVASGGSKEPIFMGSYTRAKGLRCDFLCKLSACGGFLMNDIVVAGSKFWLLYSTRIPRLFGVQISPQPASPARLNVYEPCRSLWTYLL